MSKTTINQKPGGIKSPFLAKYLDLVLILAIVLVIFAFLFPAISGEGFNASDNVASASMTKFVEKANKTGEFPLWIPHIFSGMPSYASMLASGERMFDFFPVVIIEMSVFAGNIFNSDVARVAFFYALLGIGFYLLMRAKKHEHFIALFTGVAAMLSTWVITWVMIGHNTKPVTYAMFPFIILFTEKLREKFSFLNTAFLIITLSVFFEVSHVQMMFYGICAFGIYLLSELITALIKKEKVVDVLRAAGLLALAGGIAFIMTADKYLSTLEYTPYSTRGSAPIAKTANQKQDATGGNDYQYATMWSYSPKEMITIFNPSFYGYGHRQYSNPAVTDKPILISTYWGTKESEDSPPYMGIAVVFLGFLGLIKYRKDPFVIFLFVLSVFGVFLSFGKNFPILYDLFFNLVPNFNKFRAPSMSLVLMHFSFPILAGYGLSSILKMKEEGFEKSKKALNALLYSAGGFLAVALIFTMGFKDSYLSGLKDAAATNGSLAQGLQQLSDFEAFVWSNATTDFMLNGFYVLLIALAAYFFVKNKLNKTIFFTVVGLVLIIDLWSVDGRRMEVSQENWKTGAFEENQAVYDQVKKDNSYFRVADYLSTSPNMSAYYLVNNVNGYHPAKLRVYQDIMDNANLGFASGSTNYVLNPILWNMMNVKYVLSPIPPQYLVSSRENPTDTLKGNYNLVWSQGVGNQKEQKLIYENKDNLGAAFFVGSVKTAKQMEILENLKAGNFNPKEVAFVEQDLPSAIDKPDSTAKAIVTDSKNENLKIDAKASGNNLLFISEIYYPVGWKAFIDGKETPIYKTNFAFRSIIVPQGQHKIELKFQSAKFETGKTVSLIANLITLAILGLGLFMQFKKNGQKND